MKVYFMSLPKAALMLFGRKRLDAAVPPALVGAAFILSGQKTAEEDEVIRRTAVGRDSNGRPFPIPASVYDKIRADRTRPLLSALP